MSFREKAQQTPAGNRSNLKNLSDFNGDWERYKEYLAEHGLLSPNLTVRTKSRPIPNYDRMIGGRV